MIKVLKGFYDIKEGVFRSVGQEFEESKERFDEINEALPGFVEWEDKQSEVTMSDVLSD
ncbi:MULTISPECIES: hypothetical protein [Streptococcus]|jgi:hypothetical protein|uniref:hypothetical protein n=1 Tax=Streptococcus TaxID=1301 RepID=UPI001CC104F6|nr:MULTISPECIES: hypothetical protein [Streptococcus]DAN39794.1 MAG TPA: hypothetical protein [Caudoviricetes sp.]MBZ2106923.1 hypothetical protein [Streptococcus mitis]MBZ2114719.1 hypothetical protein [Streptococcus mitis]MCY7066673.1 hypothetical protein [Streptococcus oralis]DAN69110.1 MAG TPA: hypothetical protein [Caudoviricetes sp.]